MLSGYAEPAHVNDFMFEQQRRTFSTYGRVDFRVDEFFQSSHFEDHKPIFYLLIGYALDPSVDAQQITTTSYIGAVDEAEKNKGIC